MTKSLRMSFIMLAALCLSNLNSFAYQEAAKRATARSVTGTYKYVLNRLDVLELPDHKVRISFSGFWPNDRKRVETRNAGGFDETVSLIRGKAVVKLQFGDDPCLITLAFKPNRVVVSQEGSLGSCGFGFNVEPDGAYLRTSTTPPALSPP